MALDWLVVDGKRSGKTVISPKRLCVTADQTRAVADTDPEAAFVLVGEGGELPVEAVKRYGLKLSADGRTVSLPTDEEDKPAPRDVVAVEADLTRVQIENARLTRENEDMRTKLKDKESKITALTAAGGDNARLARDNEDLRNRLKEAEIRVTEAHAAAAKAQVSPDENKSIPSPEENK